MKLRLTALAATLMAATCWADEPAFYDAFAGYGNCIVDQASRLAGTRDDAQQVIDAAIAACSKQRDTLRETTIKGWAKFSMEDAQTRADAEVARSEAAFRNSAMKAIQQARSPELAKRS